MTNKFTISETLCANSSSNDAYLSVPCVLHCIANHTICPSQMRSALADDVAHTHTHIQGSQFSLYIDLRFNQSRSDSGSSWRHKGEITVGGQSPLTLPATDMNLTPHQWPFSRLTTAWCSCQCVLYNRQNTNGYIKISVCYLFQDRGGGGRALSACCSYDRTL